MKKTERWINENSLTFDALNHTDVTDEHGRPAKQKVLKQLVNRAKKKRHTVLYGRVKTLEGKNYLVINDARSVRRWVRLRNHWVTSNFLQD